MSRIYIYEIRLYTVSRADACGYLLRIYEFSLVSAQRCLSAYRSGPLLRHCECLLCLFITPLNVGLRQAEQLVAAIEICQASMAELDAGLGLTTNARRDLACDDDELKCDYLCIGAGTNPDPTVT